MTVTELIRIVFLLVLVGGFLYLDDQQPLLPDDVYCAVGAGTKVLKHIDPIMKPGCDAGPLTVENINRRVQCTDGVTMTLSCRHGSLWAAAMKAD